jgi:hypothetical protein
VYDLARSVVCDRIGKKTRLEQSARQIFPIVRGSLQLHRVSLSAVGRFRDGHVNEDPNHRKTVPDVLNGWHQVRVSTDEHQGIALLPVGIVKHVQRDVDVRVLLFLALEETVPRHCALGMGATNALLLELPLYDLDLRKSAQRSEKRKLTLLLSRPIDERREVLHRLKIVIRA